MYAVYWQILISECDLERKKATFLCNIDGGALNSRCGDFRRFSDETTASTFVVADHELLREPCQAGARHRGVAVGGKYGPLC